MWDIVVTDLRGVVIAILSQHPSYTEAHSHATTLARHVLPSWLRLDIMPHSVAREWHY